MQPAANAVLASRRASQLGLDELAQHRASQLGLDELVQRRASQLSPDELQAGPPDPSAPQSIIRTRIACDGQTG